jgi:hypothetical protein
MQASATDYHQRFWKVSAAFNGTGEQMQTGEALKELSEIISHTGPMNPLHVMAVELREKIIYMDQPQAPKPPGATTTVLAFAPIQKKTKKPISKESKDGQTN